MKNKTFYKNLSFYLITLLFLACDPGRVYEENLEVENASWKIDDVKKFDFQIQDTTSLYNVYLNIRNTNDYPYQNLYLFIEMTSPSNKYFKDTVEVVLADSKGKWKGSGIGNIWTNQIPLLEKVRLLESGEYMIEVTQGMRHESLEAISDVGVRVEKTE